MSETEELYELVGNINALAWAALETEDEEHRLSFISLIVEQARALKAKLHEMDDGEFEDDEEDN